MIDPLWMICHVTKLIIIIIIIFFFTTMILSFKNGNGTEIHAQYEGFSRQIASSSLIDTERHAALILFLKKERFACFYHTWNMSSFCCHSKFFSSGKMGNFLPLFFSLRLFPLFTRFIILRCILVCLCVTNPFKFVQSFTLFLFAPLEDTLRSSFEIFEVDLRMETSGHHHERLNGNQPKPYLSKKINAQTLL